MSQALALARPGAFVGRASAFFFAVMLGLCVATESMAAKYAAIVIDANTGKTLYSSSADSRRYPASLTKMMTLYLTFEALQRGKIKLSTPVPFSAQAATQAPTKIGVKAGGAITVEQAVLSLITRSANDSAWALGELLGGSGSNFARMMTAKARSLGMSSTVFRNPNGLPDPGQFTSARDMAKLGLALREHFPKYYPYFSVRSFKFGRQRIANHNRLLGRVKGVDGIKTGYTRASGFNLVSSVGDGKRRIVAVILGGASGASRDNQMAELIATYMPRASGKGGGDLIAKSAPADVVDDLEVAQLPADSAPTPTLKPATDDVDVGEGDAEDGTDETAEDGGDADQAVASASAQQPASERFGGASTPVRTLEKAEKAVAARKAASTAVAAKKRDDVDPISTSSTGPRSGWSIQVASSPTPSEAKDTLQSVSAKAGGALKGKEAYTVAFDNKGTTYYRARFGGFATQAAASKACTALKKKRIACYATQ